MKHLAILLSVLLAVPAAAQMPVWKHGSMVAKSDAGIIMMPTLGGFGPKQGVDLQLLQMKDETGLMRSLISGDVDSVDGSPGVALIAGTRGVDVRILGCFWPGVPYGVLARDKIKDVQDLRGHNFAISSPSSAPDMVARAVLSHYNIPRDSIHFADLGGDADRFKAVVAGLADATVVSMEYVPIAAKNDVKVLIAARDVMPNYLRLCVTTTAKEIATRRNDVVAFMAAEIAGLRHAMADRDASLALTRAITHLPASDPRPAYIYDDAATHDAIDTELTLPMDKLGWMQDQFVALGNLPRKIDLNTLVDPSIRADALKRLAAEK